MDENGIRVHDRQWKSNNRVKTQFTWQNPSPINLQRAEKLCSFLDFQLGNNLLLQIRCTSLGTLTGNEAIGLLGHYPTEYLVLQFYQRVDR